MENKIDEAVEKAIANLNVDNLDINKDQRAKIIKKLLEDKKFVDALKNKEENKSNGKFNR